MGSRSKILQKITKNSKFLKKKWKNLTFFWKIFENFLSPKIEIFKKFFLDKKTILPYSWDQITSICIVFWPKMEKKNSNFLDLEFFPKIKKKLWANFVGLVPTNCSHRWTEIRYTSLASVLKSSGKPNELKKNWIVQCYHQIQCPKGTAR